MRLKNPSMTHTLAMEFPSVIAAPMAGGPSTPALAVAALALGLDAARAAAVVVLVGLGVQARKSFGAHLIAVEVEIDAVADVDDEVLLRTRSARADVSAVDPAGS